MVMSRHDRGRHGGSVGARNVRSTPRVTVAGNVWARMLRVAGLAGAAVALLLALVAWPWGGPPAVGSVLIGSVVVAVVFGVSLGALWWAAKYPAPVAAMTMLVLYVALVLAGAMILFATTAPSWVQPPWLGAATIGQLVAWLAGAAIAVRRSRLPVFDLPATRSSPDDRSTT